MKRVLLTAVALVAAPAFASAAELDLICRGTARYETNDTAAAYSDDFSQQRSITMTGEGQAASILYVRVREDGAGEAKLPPELIPQLRTTSRDGWRDFTELQVAEDEIRARMKLNFLDKPKIRIDRRTGDVEVVSYIGSFRGSCDKAPDENAPNKF